MCDRGLLNGHPILIMVSVFERLTRIMTPGIVRPSAVVVRPCPTVDGIIVALGNDARTKAIPEKPTGLEGMDHAERRGAMAINS